MATENSDPDELEWGMARQGLALLQFREKYLPEVRAALVGEKLAFDNHETIGRVRAVIAEICDRDRLVIPKDLLEPLVRNLIIAVDSDEQKDNMGHP
jgi:hypothetical protein